MIRSFIGSISKSNVPEDIFEGKEDYLDSFTNIDWKVIRDDTESFVNSIKERYPAGTRVIVYSMSDPRPIPCGTAGTVNHVDDMATIHVDWDNGRRLGLIVGEDSFEVL